MIQPKLVLIGAGGHSRSCIDIIERLGEFEIAGLIGMPNEMNQSHLSYTVIGTDPDLYDLIEMYQNAFIAVGQIKTAKQRIFATCSTGMASPIR